MPARDAELDTAEPAATLLPAAAEDAGGSTGTGTVTSRGARQRKLGVFGLLAIGWLAFVTVLAVLAPILPLDDPDENVASIVNQGPGTDGHLLGGDSLGRDLLSRIVWGGRASLLLGASSVLLGLLVGGLLGLTAGYFRGSLR